MNFYVLSTSVLGITFTLHLGVVVESKSLQEVWEMSAGLLLGRGASGGGAGEAGGAGGLITQLRALKPPSTSVPFFSKNQCV